MRMWLHDRLAWMDAQFLAAPQLSQDGGTIDVGAPVTASTPIGDGLLHDRRLGPPASRRRAFADGRRAGAAKRSITCSIPLRRQLAVRRQRNLPATGSRVEPVELRPSRPTRGLWVRVVHGPGALEVRAGAVRLRRRRRDDHRRVTAPIRDHKYVTTYFRHGFGLADKSAMTSLRLRLLCDDGAVVYLNGSEIARFNMPTGTISQHDEGQFRRSPTTDESRYRVFVHRSVEAGRRRRTSSPSRSISAALTVPTSVSTSN